MSNRCLRPLAVLAAIVYLAVPGIAQPPDVPLLKGELQAESPVDFFSYHIELEDLNHHGDIHRTDLRLDGAFEFRHVPAGDYHLRVVTLHGDIVKQDFVNVNPQVPNLSLRLSQPAKRPSAPGTISLTQLRHPPGRKAFQAFAAAQHFAESGSPEKAAQQLQKAIRISPEFADAYSNLAVQHIRMHRFQEAVDELTRAIALAGSNPLMLSNLAYAQVSLGRKQESLESLRAALRFDSGYPQAHLILASILAADPRTRAEAIPHLERAAQKIPAARAMLERMRDAGAASIQPGPIQPGPIQPRPIQPRPIQEVPPN